MQKNKFLFIILGIVIFLVAANIVMGQEKSEEVNEETEETEDYTKYDYKFVGESENWRGEYLLQGEEIWFEIDDKIQRKHWYDDSGIVEYKGDLSELDSVRNFQMKVGSATSNFSADKDGQITDSLFRFGNNADDVIRNPESPFTVEITWDDNTEVIELKREDSN